MELHLEMGELYSVNIETQLYNDEAAAKTWFPSHTGHIPNTQKLCVASGCCPGQQRHAPSPPPPPSVQLTIQGKKGHARGTEK